MGGGILSPHDVLHRRQLLASRRPMSDSPQGKSEVGLEGRSRLAGRRTKAESSSLPPEVKVPFLFDCCVQYDQLGLIINTVANKRLFFFPLVG